MWIDYVIGVAAGVIVSLVFGKFLFNLKKRKQSGFVCNNNCAHCKYSMKDKHDKG